MIDIILRIFTVCSLLVSARLGITAHRLNKQSKELLVQITKKMVEDSRQR